MKKISKNIILIIAIFMISIINVNAEEGVVISKAVCSNMTNGVLKSNIKVDVNSLNIAVEDTKFSKIGDYTECSLEITNNSKDEIKVDTESISNLSNENIVYSLMASNNNSIQIGKTKTYKLNISYRKEYEEDKTIDNLIEIKLEGDSANINNTNISNPNTKSPIFVGIVIILIALIATVLVLLKKKNGLNNIIMLIIITTIVTIPTVSALTSVKITLKNKIIIEIPKYHVYYKIYDQMYIPESELDNYDLSQASCEYEHYFLLEEDKNTKYYYCGYSGPKIIDSGIYKEGTSVNLQSYRYYNYFEECSNEDEYSICSDRYKDNNNEWYYSKKYSDSFKETDKDMMNFTNGLLYDRWLSSGRFAVEVSNTFTMLDHNIYFTDSTPFDE